MARLQVECFPREFSLLFGARLEVATAVAEEVLRVEHPGGSGAFVAQEGDSVVGMLLLESVPQIKVTRDWRAMWRILRNEVGLRHLPRLLLGVFLLGHKVRSGEAYIKSVAVTARARNRGVGTLLLRRAEAWARANRKRRLGLHVNMSNDRARSLYQRLGFVERRREGSRFACLFLRMPGWFYMTKGL